MIIKKILSWTVFSLLTFALWAQDRAWEIGWQMYNSHPTPTGITFENAPGPAFLNGVLVKHHKKDFGQRLNIQYLDLKSQSDPNRCCDFQVIDNRYKGVEVTLGVEKSARSGFLEYYAIFDLGLGFGQYRGSSSGGFIGGSFNTFNLRYRSLGAYPGAGATAWIKDRVGINWELRWPGVFYKTSGDTFGFTGPVMPSQGVIWQKKPESSLGVLVSF